MLARTEKLFQVVCLDVLSPSISRLGVKKRVMGVARIKPAAIAVESCAQVSPDGAPISTS